jgi:eukaryotic-like serine/threonine-protein kinase
MSEFFSFIKSRRFFIHFACIIASILLLFFVVIKGLSSFTDHGEYVNVPDFKSLSIPALDAFVKGKDVKYEIIDSIYDPKQKSGIVIRQDPESGTQVKHNRIVYLYVTGMIAPRISMPKLIDRSERQARLIITSYGLKVGRVSTKPWDCNGCVVAQMIAGKEIKEGEPIKKGSTVDLVVGEKDALYSPMAPDSASQEEPDFNNDRE